MGKDRAQKINYHESLTSIEHLPTNTNSRNKMEHEDLNNGKYKKMLFVRGYRTQVHSEFDQRSASTWTLQSPVANLLSLQIFMGIIFMSVACLRELVLHKNSSVYGTHDLHELLRVNVLVFRNYSYNKSNYVS